MIYIENQQTEIPVHAALEKLIEQVIQNGLLLEQIQESVELSVVLVDAEQIQQLNSEYRDIDQPTDVLSFALEDGDVEFPKVEQQTFRLLGDIVIALDVALAQSESFSHSFEREVAFLTAHGLLHLLGYDHGDEPEDPELAQMLLQQERILESVGLRR